MLRDYNKVLTWADHFDNCTLEAKKMIVAEFIKQMRANKDYNLEIDLNVSYEKFVSVAGSEHPQAEKVKMPA